MRNKTNGQRRAGYAVVAMIMFLALALGAGLLSKFSATATTPITAAKNGPRMDAPAGAIDTSATKPDAPVAKTGVTVIHATNADTSIPFRDMVPATGGTTQEGPENPVPSYHSWGSITDSVVQNFFGPLAMPTPILSFDGTSFNTGGTGWPPDTNGDVSLSDYVQTVNGSIQIWDKTGAHRMGPVHINTLFAGFGGPCQTTNAGDPVVLYDQAADRWFVSQFTTSNPYGQCIAISTTSDPTGTYYRYFFAQSTTDLYDYPHYGVWTDGYYFTANKFAGGTTFTGPAFGAFERAKMLVGDNTATYQEINPGSFFGNDLPADIDGANPPPAGSPGIFGSAAGTFSSWRTWHFHVDYATPANSVLTGPFTTAVAQFDPDMCGGSRDCIPQPGTTRKLDALDDRQMHRLVYRNMGSYETLVATNRVDASGTDHAGVRWYEIHDPLSNAPTLYQQGTYAPDADNRWLPSIAMDGDGNIAVGYSVSSAATYPSLRYAGRLVGDPLGQLTQGEGTLIAGTGSQTTINRWGDYASMSIDPSDDCTFWFTSEYYATSGSNWQTRIGSFKFPGCGQTTPTPTATGTPPTATATASPSATFTAVPTICLNYAVATATGTIVPATGDVGIHCDDCGRQIPLPFSVKSYGTSYNALNLDSNGVVQFGSSSVAYGNSCLPALVYDHAIMMFWDDLTTQAAGQGYFTATAGIAPNRVFYLELKATSLADSGTFDAELTLHEDSNNFELTYGPITTDSNSATIGVQGPYQGANTRFTQVSCNTTGLTAGTQYEFTLADCPAPPTETATTVPTGTAVTTGTPAVTGTPATATETVTGTPPTATQTPTACTISFEDVPSGSTFYTYIECLACRGVINGYPCGGPLEPCNPSNDPYFRPSNNVTRGQFAKIASIAAGFVEPAGGLQYTDVPIGSTYYDYIWRLSSRGFINGYPCGGAGEPCDGANRPYFRPNANVTRGQLSKIDANAAGFNDTATGQQYEDVLPGSTFYDFIYRLSSRGIIGGYPCGGVSEPCGSGNLPYFRPNANATRGQASKIVSNTFFPECSAQLGK